MDQRGGGTLSIAPAFTLAEVLVTLGIIGVVAAMTMPSLIAKYQQKTFETAFKKQYSVLNNAINFLILDESIQECYIEVVPDSNPNLPNNKVYSEKNSDCRRLKDGLISKLKLTPVDDPPVYTQSAKVLENGGVSVNQSVQYSAILNDFTTFLIPDGALLMFYYDKQSSLRFEAVNFVIDINGKKGPNRWGYDVFWLCLNQRNGKIRLTDEYAALSEKGGSLPRNILMNKWSNEYKLVNYGVW